MRNEFFQTDEFRAAFASQHIGKVFKAYRNHPRHRQLFGKALNQELLGRWLGLTQAQVSKLENGKPEQNLDSLRSYAKKLHLPQHLLWFDFPGQSRLAFPQTAESKKLITPASERDELLVVNTGMDTLELLRRLRASAINPSTIDAVSITVEQLCCDYPHKDARTLMVEGKEWLGKMTTLLESRLSLAQHREVLQKAGMLALLVGCLEYDTGDRNAAEATRRMAMTLGEESGDQGIVGWAHEMRAWFHLTAGNFRAVIAAAEEGILAAPSHSVAVQLYGQQAKAYARMGKPDEVRQALDAGSTLLDQLPFPERPDNHFVVDPDKWDFYAMDTYRIVGEDQLAQRNAEEVIRRGVSPEGEQLSPMRIAEAELTLAVIAARRGEVEEAAGLGIQALRSGRQSRPTLLMVSTELEDELATYGNGAGRDFRDLLAEVKRPANGNIPAENI
ncbi:helix-turn-helix domain-containing protein [Amycolatopsis roodepoortensis]|uniref:Tetratricopeptide (TPR) repeat protein n=1 Tax=Amycolatopsis roodepoortensis TaxID=700274 RepID=A0ABR9KXZ0_9PSEU|nr:helix-turn-helix transcriptional regulator [Amycolatopsis roodepoortensis]MBE1572981.1 tetratricopeptide (TPR) repeat protein [Amycolatopsis roodepoortensis]MBE1576877.1 tetratricopeptide (TPR) repeat protein [Amycolatopsis roodepoortensis]